MSGRRRDHVPNIISPEAASDQSTIQNVFGFLQDYVPQAVTGQKEERRERVLWALFETGDINDVTMEHRGSAPDPLLPLLLILGFASGYSVWNVSLGGDAQEVFSVRGEREAARVVRLLRTPEGCEGVGPDKYASQRPIIAVVKKASGSVAYSTVFFISLASGQKGRGEDKGGGIAHKLTFRPKPIVDIKCNRRVVVVVLQKRVVVLDAGTLQSKFVIKNGYPSLGYPCNPVALATRWMAFSETKLVSKHQSVGGMSDTTHPSVATTVFKNVKKGISAFTETISGLAGRPQPSGLETADTTSQPEQATANVVSIIDVNQVHSQEVRLSELGREGGVVAHFVAHTGPNVNVAALAFNPSGTLLLSASTEGHHFHVFRILPHPWLSSETAVHHLYTLFRGATAGLVQDICFSADSRWVAVSTLNGTTHIFPITPYGGIINVRTHTSPRVVNQLSRFHTTAGIETFPPSKSHANPTQTHSQSPPRESTTARDYSAMPVANSYGVGTNWTNPRGLPLPTPSTVSALQQIKQPYLSTAGDTPSKKTSASSATTSPLSRPDAGEPFLTLAGPDSLCVRATFSAFPPCEATRGRNESSEQTASYSLYVVGSHGVLTEHLLEPRKATDAPEGEDAPIELGHQPRVCWRLLSKPPSVFLPLPLRDDNPLVLAYSEYRKFCDKAKEGGTQTQTGPKTDGEWLSQVEILTHAPPSRRLWMGPQFSFKAYQSPGNHLPAAFLSPSPPNTVIYSGSLNSPSNTPAASGGLPSPGTAVGERARERADMQGRRQSGQEEDFAPHSAVLSTTEPPLLDLLSEPLEAQNLALKTIQTSPLPMPSLRSSDRGPDGMESGPPSLEPGVVEVFGSWKKVAPHLGGPHLEAEQVERQLAEAMCEQDSPPTVTVVAGSSGAKTGFFPLDESR